MILISVNLPEAYLLALENMVTHGFFPNRAEAIRAAVRDMIKDEYKRAKLMLKSGEFSNMNTIRYTDHDGYDITRTILKRLD